jgi:threonine aldolase
MTNQIAISVHTERLDEIICDENSHVYHHEVGGYSHNSGVAINLIHGENGKITAQQIKDAIKPNLDWLPRSRLVVIENTSNKGGGTYYSVAELKPIHKLCKDKGLLLHLDGARIFNALVETRDKPTAIGKLFDSISVCLSKGLGAPVGSLLIGDEVFISKARRVRKVMGGGMRQAGYMAAAGIYALDHHIERLKIDHENAKKLGKVLLTLPYVENVRPVQTNIVIFDVKPPFTSASFIKLLEKHKILASSFGPKTIRFCTHLDIDEVMVEMTIETLKQKITKAV